MFRRLFLLYHRVFVNFHIQLSLPFICIRVQDNSICKVFKTSHCSETHQLHQSTGGHTDQPQTHSPHLEVNVASFGESAAFWQGRCYQLLRDDEKPSMCISTDAGLWTLDGVSYTWRFLSYIYIKTYVYIYIKISFVVLHM